ncbi:transporter suffix domain-containing protein [Paenisporosarcina cavernae]|uniref:Transporter suffix domain-containing protein n=1 Tax=Paenisporosarcina cavernae TaxID=2320858 RepID=A0A385YUZ2_9BACL|nr:transporter suffix domain-containing protein [Paenisporosarcina cavernae]AYC30506.1 transporter suffix domain-containing protein [Paenisporosarcina cavernae]
MEPSHETPSAPKSKTLYRIGLVFIGLSVILWLFLPVIPFLELSTGMKASIAAGTLIAAEIVFWVGALFVGKEVAQKFKRYLNPSNWKKRQEVQKEEEEK